MRLPPVGCRGCCVGAAGRYRHYAGRRGNARAALNKETLGVPVIAVGVPTVVDGATLAHEISSQLGSRIVKRWTTSPSR
ncbi:MAG: GPR endopeptidase [Butyricicoccus sp.]